MASKGFFGNWVVKNLLWAAILIAVLVFGSQIFLSVYTRHGDEISVPDLVSLPLEDALEAASRLEMNAEVVDSIYVKNISRGVVVRQDPSAGTMVKEGRRIQLTINAVAPRKIPMPNLIGYSLRSASAELSARGLRIGRKIYVWDMATNNVLRQLYKGEDIEPGMMIPNDAVIDLVLGLNPDDR